MNEAAFQRARAEPAYRQEFLASVPLEDKAPYVNGVEYNTQEMPNPFWGSHNIMCAQPNLVTVLNIPRTRTKIVVASEIFSHESFRTYGDFVSTLVDHEGTHAEELYKEPAEFRKMCWNVILGGGKPFGTMFWKRICAFELRAYYAQVQKFEQRNVSQEYAQFIRQKQNELQEQLRNLQA